MNIKRYEIFSSDLDRGWDYNEKEEGSWAMYEDLQPLLARLEYLERMLNIANTKIIKVKEVLG